MSGTNESRAKQQIQDLIDELGQFRNSNTRDPGFKQWRQNTLTLTQLLWPNDASKSDHFRRVPFSTPSNRFNAKLTREFYERGCAEAVAFLKSLLEDIDQNGVPDTASFAPARGVAPGSAEDDFPMVDLPGGSEAAAPPPPKPAAKPASTISRVLSKGDANPLDPIVARPSSETPPPDLIVDSPEVALAPVSQRPLAPRASSAAPPPVEIPRFVSPPPARVAPPAPPAARVQPPAPSNPEAEDEAVAEKRRVERRKGPRLGAWARKPQPKGRLKDMLGFSDEAAPPEAAETSAAPMAETPSAQANAPVESAGPTPPTAAPAPFPRPRPGRIVASAAPPASVPPPAPAAPAPVAPATPVSPRAGSAASDWELPQTPLKQRQAATPPPASPKRSRDRIVEIVGAEPPLRPVAPPPAEEPVAEEPSHASESYGATDSEAWDAAEEFLRTSPVLSSQAKPVKRGRKPDAPQPSPTAIALAAVASEVGYLGVPDGQRAGARAALLELARQLDEHALNWNDLRDSVHLVMHYPALARRVLPLLVPYLDTAA